MVSDLELTSKAELAFKALDKNSDGFISKREFNEISKTLTKEQVSTVCQLIDWYSVSSLVVPKMEDEFSGTDAGKNSK